MIELYVFIAAFIAIVFILVRRFLVVKREEKKAFKEKVSKKVEENRKLIKEEEKTPFKKEHLKQEEAKRHDIGKFKEEMRQAEMALSKNDFAEAKKFLIQAMALTPDDIPVGLKLAKVYMETKDYKRAEALYREMLENETENPEIYEGIGKIMLKNKAYKEAIQAYVRAVELDEKNHERLIALGQLYHLMMRYGVAAECFRRAAELKPREVDYLFLLADACVADEDFENALFTYEKVLTIEPYNDKAKSFSQDVRLKIKEQEALFSD